MKAAPAAAAPVLARLEKMGSKAGRDGMARFGIPPGKAFGVPMNRIRALARELGPSHELAAALWRTDRYEARMLAAFVDEPGKVTAAQMDRWCRDFDNWAHVDTLCFALFDKTKDAWSRVPRWTRLEGEFQRRAGLALLWAIALHDRTTGEAAFMKTLPLVERVGADNRHYVRKAVEMALRAIARRSPALAREVEAVKKRIAAARRSVRSTR